MKVRIYKSLDGNGKYLNKTGQFLEKAQKGKIVKDVLKYGKQLIMNFDETDKIQKATKLAKAIDKSNKAGRAAGAIKYGEGVKKATTASSKIQIKNPAFFQEVLNSSNLSPSTRKYHEEVIKAVMKNNNLATQSQYNTLQRIKNGTFPKYQAGGVPDVSEMGYPGSAKENKEYTQDDLVNVIVNDLNNDIDEQKIAFKLSSFYSVDPMEAMQLVNQVQDYLNNADDSEEEDNDDEIKNQNIVEEEVPEEEIVDDTNEEESAALANDSTGIDLALEEDEEEYSYGGMYKAQEGEEVNTEISQNFQTPSYPFNSTAPEITFPSIDTYLPFNISDMLDGTIDPATGIYANYYNNEDNNEDNTEENTEEDTEDTSEYALNTPPEMKMGGNYKRNKKAYVNSIIKLSKKADGGEEVKSDEDPEAGDPTGAKIRKQKLNNFIGSLKKETEMFNLKQQAEQQYDQMMQQQMQPQNNMMRRGGSAGSRDPKVVRGNELRYRANQLKDFITGRNRRDREEENNYDYTDATDNIIRGQFDEQRPGYRVDVRKSNWLTGKPSKYTIDFYGNSPLINIAKENIITSNIPKSNVNNNSSSKNIPINTISTAINKESTIKIDEDIKNKNQVLFNDFYTKDDNKDLIPDYLQPGIMSGLSTNLSKEIFTQAAVDAVNNLSSIKSNVIPKSNVIIPQVPVKSIIPIKPIPLTIIKPKVITKVKTKVKPKVKNKIKYEDVYRDPTYYEQFQRFFNAGPKETGGFVDSENPDLYEFNQGGYDPTQQDIDYSNSIDTTDPYFKRGGGVRKFIENYFPGNILSPQRIYRNEIQRVYDPRTGKTVVMPINMGNLSSVNVDKSRFWSGAPKKYTMYFNGQSDQPITTSKGTDASQRGRDRYCLDFPNSPNCQGGKKPVRDNYPEDTRENNKNQRSGRQGYGFINDLKLRMQGLDEYGNPKGSKQSDKVPLSNEEMLIKQGKIWDEKSKRWIIKPEPLSAPMQYMKDSLTLPNNPQPFSSDQLINTSGPRNTEMQYGGYMPDYDYGGAFDLGNDCPAGSTKNAIGDCVDFMGKVVKKRSTGSDFGNNTPEIKQPGVMDKDYRNPLTGEKPGVIKDKSGNLKMNEDAPTFYGDQYAIDVENKSDKGKLTFGKGNTGVSEARLQTFNAGVDIADSIRRGIETNKAENEMYENLSSNNLYASDPSRDRGDYDTNSGLYRPDEQGQMWNSRSKQFGGYIDEEEYYDPYLEEDELTYAKGGEKITYMSEDQIRAFMAEGGQVEFL